MNTQKPNRAREIKAALTDVRRLCDALGLTADGPRTFTKQSGGLIVRCPVHNEKTASCSVQLRHGVILWHCHGCGAGGDALDLVATVNGLSMRSDFREALIEAARLAGLWAVVAELESRSESTPRPMAPATLPQEPPEPQRSYPDGVESFWQASRPAAAAPEVAEYLRGRAIDPEAVDARDLARVISEAGALPRWARYRGQSWRETGHRLLVPMFDATGALRSVRGWRVVDGDSPKRLPPGGHKASELVMADSWAIAWLRHGREPQRVVISEGEPDFVVWATRLNDPRSAVIGIVSGSWHQALAERFPVGCRVDVRVDHDEAGGRYFAEIESSLKRRTPAVYRSVEAA